jgi:hypothetical protein
MSIRSTSTGIVVIVVSLAICWVAAFAIEDAGKHPYRAWQMTSNKQRPMVQQWPDNFDNVLPSLR